MSPPTGPRALSAAFSPFAVRNVRHCRHALCLARQRQRRRCGTPPAARHRTSAPSAPRSSVLSCTVAGEPGRPDYRRAAQDWCPLGAVGSGHHPRPQNGVSVDVRGSARRQHEEQSRGAAQADRDCGVRPRRQRAAGGAQVRARRSAEDPMRARADRSWPHKDDAQLQSLQALGRMFWFRRKKLSGSYFALIC
jgi:hypothetical protein